MGAPAHFSGSPSLISVLSILEKDGLTAFLQFLVLIALRLEVLVWEIDGWVLSKTGWERGRGDIEYSGTIGVLVVGWTLIFRTNINSVRSSDADIDWPKIAILAHHIR
jgi:hypothetical protein